MMPLYQYIIYIDITGNITKWFLEATEDETERLVEKISKSEMHPRVWVESFEGSDFIETHRLDSDGYVWAKTSIKIEGMNYWE